MQAKWIEVFLELLRGNKPQCPHCGSTNLDYGYVLFEPDERIGYGALWCKECNHAFSLSRAHVKENDKVLAVLPDNLIYT